MKYTILALVVALASMTAAEAASPTTTVKTGRKASLIASRGHRCGGSSCCSPCYGRSCCSPCYSSCCYPYSSSCCYPSSSCCYPYNSCCYPYKSSCSPCYSSFGRSFSGRSFRR